MAFPHNKLTPKSGSISAHIYENKYVGLEQNLFISINIDFLPVKYASENWGCSFSLEWLPFPGGSWKDIQKLSSDNQITLQGSESSFYMVEHDPCEIKKLKIIHEKDNIFRLQIDATVDFSGYTEGDENPIMPIKIDILLPFSGFSLDRNIFFPKPNTVDDALKMASKYIDIESFLPPIERAGTFKFIPKIS